MPTTSLKLEKQYLIISAVGNVLLGCVGVAIAAVSSSQAVLLDGLFNLAYFTTALFTVKIASLVAGGDDERFPYGYAFFEPLVNGLKGVLMLGVTVMALAGAVRDLLTGGRTIAAGFAIAYGVFACAICGTVAYVTHRGAKLTDSPLVRADAQNWIVNAAFSCCVLLAFAGMLVLRALGFDGLTPYVDPTVVLVVVAISVVVPIRMSWKALMELLNRAPDRSVVKQVTEIVDANLRELPVQERFIRVVQPGRQRMVLVHVVLDAKYRPDGLGHFDAIRTQTNEALGKDHVDTYVDILFTADRQWGAPLSDGGAGGGAGSGDPRTAAGSGDPRTAAGSGTARSAQVS
jgi:cation diffusion facilitator family transporter